MSISVRSAEKMTLSAAGDIHYDEISAAAPTIGKDVASPSNHNFKGEQSLHRFSSVPREEMSKDATSDCFQGPSSKGRLRQRRFHDSDEMDKAAPSYCFQ